jgi:putative ABC transport system permease protein
MTAYGRKVLRDFSRERTRTALVVTAMAAGIAGFCAMLSSYAILTRELNRGYLDTNPASATIRTSALDDATVAAVAATAGIAAAEPRRVVSGRIKAGPARWQDLRLFVVKDYGDIRVSRLKPQRGAWPPATGEILIERDALQVARARIGDTVTVKTLRGREAALRVSGTVHDVGQAQARMENLVYGYITLATLEQLGEQPYLDQLNILVADHQMDEAHIRNLAADVRRVLEARGLTVRRVDVPTPGKHPHAGIMGVLLLAMSSFGLCVLGLSGVLVINLMTALMAAKVRQIGVMKAIGGTRSQIEGIYFSQALLIGGAAVHLALPFGIAGTRWLCEYMAVFLNFDIASYSVPAWVYLLVAAIGLLAPLLAALYPVSKGSAMPVREALGDFGVASAGFGTSAVDRMIAGISGGFLPVVLSIRNSFRRRARLVLTLVTLSAGGLFFLTALNVRSSLVRTLDRLFAARKYDLSVTLAQISSVEAIERAVRNTPGVQAAEAWLSTEGSLPASNQPPATGGAAHTIHIGESPSDTFTVLALPAKSDMIAMDLAAGRSLGPDDTDAIVMNTALAARRPEFRVGNSVTLRVGPANPTWRIVGIVREPFSPAVAYIPKAYVERLGGHGAIANQLRLKLDRGDPDSLDAARAALDRSLEQENLRATGAMSKADSRYAFDEHMVMIYVFLIVASGIIAGVGGLGLGTTMSINVLERRREMAILRAIGASPRVIWRIVAAEGIAIAVMSWIVAVALAWPVSRMLGNLLTRALFQNGLDFRFETAGLVVWLAVSIVVGAAASFLPAWHAARSTIRESL